MFLRVQLPAHSLSQPFVNDFIFQSLIFPLLGKISVPTCYYCMLATVKKPRVMIPAEYTQVAFRRPRQSAGPMLGLLVPAKQGRTDTGASGPLLTQQKLSHAQAPLTAGSPGGPSLGAKGWTLATTHRKRSQRRKNSEGMGNSDNNQNT